MPVYPGASSSTATAAPCRDHVRSAIIAGQRPRPDFWHPTPASARRSPGGLVPEERGRSDHFLLHLGGDPLERVTRRQSRPDPLLKAPVGRACRPKRVRTLLGGTSPTVTSPSPRWRWSTSGRSRRPQRWLTSRGRVSPSTRAGSACTTTVRVSLGVSSGGRQLFDGVQRQCARPGQIPALALRHALS
jgi:hypothetical protein